MRIGIMAAVLTVIFVSAFNPSPANAGWVDDWFDQATYSGASSFEGQKRGYYTAGNFSARFSHSNDYLATASLPEFKSGCGGIDAFLGGFSFMDMEYLGDKFQNIMTAAPVFAFNIALRALSEQYADEISKLENITNALNGIQLDDCKAAKAMVTIASDTFTGKTNAAKEELTSLAMDTGLYELYKAADSDTQSDPSSALSQTKSEVTGNDADLENLLYQAGSLLAKAASKYDSDYDTKWVDLIRGYIGDLYLTSSGNPLSLIKIEPCLDNQWNENYGDFVQGTAQMKEEGSEDCTQITDEKSSIHDFTTTTMKNIITKTGKGSGTSLTGEEQQFIELSPVPVYLHLKMAKVEKMENAFIETVSQEVAYAYAIKQLKDLYELMDKMLSRYHKDISNKDEVSNFRDNALKNIKDLQDRIKPELVRLDGKLREKITDYDFKAARFFDRQKEFNNIVRHVFSSKKKM
ncbi:MAG: conjugal transfer protein TraH [Deltaproteobacteria bacterium]|nr:conjugal transfer protein TraH [Deltaproteobacteria bacterium]